MPTQSWRIDLGSDDCKRWRRNGTSGFDKDGNYLGCGDDTDSWFDYISGMRFINIIIPQGSVIDSAYLTLMARPSAYGVLPTTYIEGQDSDGTITFSDIADFDARPRTSANIPWTPIAWLTDQFYTSPDIKTVIQEIIDRPGWSSGNALVLFWRDTAGWGGEHKFLSAAAREYGLPDRAKLEITWTPAGVTHYKTVSEILGLVDSKSTIVAYHKTVSEALGLVDSWDKNKCKKCKPSVIVVF